MKVYLYICLLLISTYANASLWDGDSGMLVQLTKMLQQAKLTLEEAKKQSNKLNELNGAYKEMANSFKSLKNPNLNSLGKDIDRDFSGIEGFEDIEGLNFKDKAEKIKGILDQRSADAKGEDREEVLSLISKQKSLLDRMVTLNKLQNSTTKNISSTSTDLSQRDSNRIIAEQMSIISAIQLKREEELLKQKQSGLSDKRAIQNINKQYRDTADRNVKQGW